MRGLILIVVCSFLIVPGISFADDTHNKKDFELSIKASRDIFNLGEPISIEMTLRNISDTIIIAPEFGPLSIHFLESDARYYYRLTVEPRKIKIYPQQIFVITGEFYGSGKQSITPPGNHHISVVYNNKVTSNELNIKVIMRHGDKRRYKYWKRLNSGMDGDELDKLFHKYIREYKNDSSIISYKIREMHIHYTVEENFHTDSPDYIKNEVANISKIFGKHPEIYENYGLFLQKNGYISDAIDAFTYGGVTNAVDILEDLVQGETSSLETANFVIDKSLQALKSMTSDTGRLTAVLATAYYIKGDIDAAVRLARPLTPKEAARWEKEKK